MRAWLWQFARFLYWRYTHPRHRWVTIKTNIVGDPIRQRCGHRWCGTYRAINMRREHGRAKSTLWLDSTWTEGGPDVQHAIIDEDAQAAEKFLESLK